MKHKTTIVIDDLAILTCLLPINTGQEFIYLNTQKDLNNKLLKTIKHDLLYLDMCDVISKFSYCQRKLVGCILVKDRQIISHGYNGTLPGTPNICEDEKCETLSSVIHAEKNAIAKLAKSGNSGDNSTAYVNLSPCIDCLTLLLSSGITRIVFNKTHSSFNDIQKLDYNNNINLEIYNYTPINDLHLQILNKIKNLPI